jgi:hypothetical protein
MSIDRFVRSLVTTSTAIGVGLLTAQASAQPDEPTSATPAEAPSTTLTAPLQPAPTVVGEEPAAAPAVVSLAIERFGALGYTSLSGDGGSGSVSIAGFGSGAAPVTAPRIGVDYIFASGLSLGVAGVAMYSSASGSGSTDVSTSVYGIGPRVGYRLQLSKHVDITPRVGVIVSGDTVSVSAASQSILLVGGVVDAPFAFRLTESLNILLSPDLSAGYASASATGGVSAKTGGSGSFWALQAWLGVGGYL